MTPALAELCSAFAVIGAIAFVFGLGLWAGHKDGLQEGTDNGFRKGFKAGYERGWNMRETAEEALDEVFPVRGEQVTTFEACNRPGECSCQESVTYEQ
jgi:hypothetical protein